jgi:hypothetical protein
MLARRLATLVVALAACDSPARSPTTPPPYCRTIARVPLDWGVTFLSEYKSTLIVGGFDNNPGAIDHFSTVNIDDPSNPQVLGTLTMDGLWGPMFPRYDGHMLLGSGHVIDVSNLAAPTVVATIPGWLAMAQVDQDFAQLHEDAITIVNLDNLSMPRTIGTLAGTSLFTMVLAQNTAYVTQTGSSPALLIMDLSNHASPVQVGSLSLPYVGYDAPFGSYLFLGAITGPDADAQGLYVVDIHNPASPTIVGHVPDRNFGPYGMGEAADGPLLLSLDDVFNFETPTSPRLIGRPLLPPNAQGELPTTLTVMTPITDLLVGIYGTNQGVFMVDLSCNVPSQ